MRIAVVDLVALSGGGYTVTKSLYDYVASGQGSDHTWLFIVSEQEFESNTDAEVVHFPKAATGYLQRAKTEYFDVNRILDKFKPDIVLSMPNISVLGCKRDQAVYLQQSLPFQKEKNFSFLKREERSCAVRQHLQGLIIRRSLKKVKCIFVQTEWMKRALEESMRDRSIVKLGYPMGQTNNSPVIQAEGLNQDFFYPAGPFIYKNHQVIFDAVSILQKKGYSPKIYLTVTPDDFSPDVQTRIEKLGGIICIGRQSKRQMSELYAKTTLVFPSYIETVGLPLAEARAAGTWIIASNCPFSNEVLAGYVNCEYFAPFCAQQLADCMERVITGEVKWTRVPHTEHTAESCWNILVREMENLVMK